MHACIHTYIHTYIYIYIYIHIMIIQAHPRAGAGRERRGPQRQTVAGPGLGKDIIYT